MSRLGRLILGLRLGWREVGVVVYPFVDEFNEVALALGAVDIFEVCGVRELVESSCALVAEVPIVDSS